MSKRISCKGCGRCCHDLEDMRLAWWDLNQFASMGNPTFEHKDDKEFREATTRGLHYRHLIGPMNIARLVGECFSYDNETTSCINYKERPTVCVRLERGKEGCRELRATPFKKREIDIELLSST